MSRRTQIGMALLAVCWLFPFLVAPIGGLFTLPNLSAGYSDAARTLLLLLALATLSMFGAEAVLRALPKPVWGTVGGLLAWGTLSCLLSADPFQAGLFFQQFLAAALLFLATATACCSKAVRGVLSSHVKELRLTALHAPALLMVLWALVPILLRSDLERATAGLLLPAGLATWCLLFLAFTLAEAMSEERSARLLGQLSSSLLLSALLLSGSRGAWLVSAFLLAYAVRFLRVRSKPGEAARWLFYHGLVLVLLVLLRGSLGLFSLVALFLFLLSLPLALWVWQEGSRTRRVRALASVLLLCAFWTLVVEAVRPSPGVFSSAEARLESLQEADESAAARLHFWRASLMMLRDHPVTGIGPGRFGTVYPRYQTKVTFYSESPHSLLLEFTSDFGTVGLALLLALVWAVRRRILTAHTTGHPVAQGALLGLAASLAYSMIEVGYHFASLWVLWACTAGLLFLTEDPKPHPAHTAPGSRLGAFLMLSSAGLLLWLLSLEVTLERSKSLEDPTQTLSAASRVATALPYWERANTAAIRAGMEAQADSATLELLIERAIANEPDSADLYFLAGEFAYRERQWERAERFYRTALSHDSYNYPSVYHSLLLLAASRGDTQEYATLQREILERYSVQDVLTAHGSQKENLKSQIVPLFLDVADGVNPYQNPIRAEALYREILKAEESPRALHGLGISLWTQGRFREGHPYLEEAHRRAPGFPPPPALPESN